MKVWGTQSCPTLCNPMDCSLPGSSVYGILQVRILEWIVMPSSRGSSWSRDWTHNSCLLHWQADSLPAESQRKPLHLMLPKTDFWGSSLLRNKKGERFLLILFPSNRFWELVMDREASRSAIHGVTKSQTRLRNWTELNLSSYLFLKPLRLSKKLSLSLVAYSIWGCAKTH